LKTSKKNLKNAPPVLDPEALPTMKNRIQISTQARMSKSKFFDDDMACLGEDVA
jgi:hypothetical protein